MSDSLQPHELHTPGFPVLHYLPQFAQAHVRRFSDATNCILYFELVRVRNYEFLSIFYCIDFLCLTINMSDSLTISVINGLNSIIL